MEELFIVSNYKTGSGTRYFDWKGLECKWNIGTVTTTDIQSVDIQWKLPYSNEKFLIICILSTNEKIIPPSEILSNYISTESEFIFCTNINCEDESLMKVILNTINCKSMQVINITTKRIKFISEISDIYTIHGSNLYVDLCEVSDYEEIVKKYSLFNTIPIDETLLCVIYFSNHETTHETGLLIDNLPRLNLIGQYLIIQYKPRDSAYIKPMYGCYKEYKELSHGIYFNTNYPMQEIDHIFRCVCCDKEVLSGKVIDIYNNSVCDH